MTLRRLATIVPWLGLGLFFFIALMGEQGVLRLWQIQTDTSQLSQELNRSRREAVILESQVRRMRSDPRFIEKVAREELSLVRDDEILYRFED